MDKEESETIERLCAAGSDPKAQKAALKRLAEMLEETYILNLPPSKKILTALSRYAKQAGTSPVVSKQALKVRNQYKI